MGRARRIAALALGLMLLALCACGAKDDLLNASTALSEPQVQQGEVESTPEAPVLEPLPLATDFNALTGLARSEGMLDGQRPVAIAISNNARALPQRGVAAADVVVEMVTEGGITRLLALYSDYRSIPQVGPVRSTRDQFVQFALPLNAIQAHIGTSVYARNLLDVVACTAIDGLYLGSMAFWFDAERGRPRPGGYLNEYCWFTDAGLIAQGMEIAGVAATGDVRALFQFDTSPSARGQEAVSIGVVYSGASNSTLALGEDGRYYKYNLGAPHCDEDGTQLAYENVLILKAGIGLKADAFCSEFDFREGTGYYFNAGRVVPLVWIKGGPQDALRLFDEDGRELAVKTGKTYVGFVPNDTADAVTWQAG